MGVSESSVKRWVDSGSLTAAKTAGGHRRIPLSEAVRFIRARKLPIVDRSILGLADVSRVPDGLVDAPVTEELLVKLLTRGASDEARGLIVAAYLRGDPLAPLCDGPIREAMNHVGNLWYKDRQGIAVEHVATDVFLQAFHQIRALVPPAGPDAPQALGAAFSGDPYALPSLMAATILADLSFEVTHLGPDTPPDVLAQAAEDRNADLVWISVTAEMSESAIREAAAMLSARLASVGTRIVIGGRATERFTFNSLPKVSLERSMTDLAEIASGIVRDRAASRA
jgi:MerR family transcriptional regulator, light-induced transcriptional regulator